MQETHSPTDPFTEKSLSVSAFPDALLIVNRSGMALPELGPLLVTSGLNMAKSQDSPSAAAMGVYETFETSA